MYFSELKLAEKISKMLYITVTENEYNRYELIHKWLALSHTTIPSTFTFICAHRLKHIFSLLLKENLRTICPQLTREALCRILDSYGALHTVSVKRAIKEIKENDVLTTDPADTE